MISTIILSMHWLIIIGLSMRVIMRRPPLGVSLAWLAVIFSVPFLGAAAYLLFGEKRLGRARALRIKAQLVPLARWQESFRECSGSLSPGLESDAEPLLRLAGNVLGFPPAGGNELELIRDFQSVFDRMIVDIDSAQNTVHLGFYIWHGAGRMVDVVDALVRAAKRGVHCRCLADGMGSSAFLKSEPLRRLREAGVDFVEALPTGILRTFVARTDLRNHRKIAVIDDRVAYSGSQNLVDPHFFKQESGVGEWVDAMVRITGPAVAALDVVFRLDWSVETGSTFEPPPFSAVGSSGQKGSVVQIAPSGPDLYPEAIQQLLLTAIYAARRELVMTTPYFVPDDSLLTALLTAARRGVRVTLIVPARNDSMLVRHASVAHFEDLMSAGVCIALFKGGLLHTKSLAIDDVITMFGSVNLDMRSLWLNFEISLFVYDHDFTGCIRTLQETYLRDSDLLDPATWRLRSPWRRYAENTCRLLAPLL